MRQPESSSAGWLVELVVVNQCFYVSVFMGWWSILRSRKLTFDLCRGVAKLVKAPDFDSGIRRFDSFHPCQIFKASPKGEFQDSPDWRFRRTSDPQLAGLCV